MNDSFYIGATGLRAQQAALEVVSNNMANLNTTAFKRGAVAFGEMVAAAPAALPGSAPLPAAQAGATALGVSLAGLPRVLSAGEYRKSANALDVAVKGSGFIELLGTDGQPVLWRGGTLALDRNNLLTGPGGLALKGVSALPPRTQSVQIDERGQVFAQIAGQTNARRVGQIELATVAAAAALEPMGDGLYRVSDGLAEVVRGRPGEQGLGSVAQGWTEGSNVNVADEMVSLLWIQRSYAANARVVQAADELMSLTNGLKR